MSHALEKQRIAHLYAARLLLRQLRACNDVWSDGRTVYRGAELRAYRTEVLDRIAGLKERNPVKRRAPKMGRMCKNLSLGKSFLSPKTDENTADWLSRLLKDYGGSNDIGGKERSLTARRLLRKNYPKHAAALDPLVRFDDQEWGYVLQSFGRHRWVLKEDLDFSDGMTLSAGVEVVPSNRGFLVALSNFQVPVPALHICKAKDFRRETEAGKIPRSLDESPAP